MLKLKRTRRLKAAFTVLGRVYPVPGFVWVKMHLVWILWLRGRASAGESSTRSPLGTTPSSPPPQHSRDPSPKIGKPCHCSVIFLLFLSILPLLILHIFPCPALLFLILLLLLLRKPWGRIRARKALGGENWLEFTSFRERPDDEVCCPTLLPHTPAPECCSHPAAPSMMIWFIL